MKSWSERFSCRLRHRALQMVDSFDTRGVVFAIALSFSLSRLINFQSKRLLSTGGLGALAKVSMTPVSHGASLASRLDGVFSAFQRLPERKRAVNPY